MSTAVHNRHSQTASASGVVIGGQCARTVKMKLLETGIRGVSLFDARKGELKRSRA